MTQRVLVVGLGNMGMSHAMAYTRIPGFEVVGVCERRIANRKMPEALKGARTFSNFEEALATLKPDVVSINTLPDTHADFAIKAMEAGAVKSDDINAHTKTNQILWHHADMSKPDERIDMTDEPDHDGLCEREQRYLLKAINENIDLTDHMDDAVKSLKIVIAADRSIHTGQVVDL